jgi:hypothetical protein
MILKFSLEDICPAALNENLFVLQIYILVASTGP